MFLEWAFGSCLAHSVSASVFRHTDLQNEEDKFQTDVMRCLIKDCV